VFEIRKNTMATLQTNQLARVRKFALHQKSLDNAAEKMKAYMTALVAAYAQPS